jgi:hypothetical protein
MDRTATSLTCDLSRKLLLLLTSRNLTTADRDRIDDMIETVTRLQTAIRATSDNVPAARGRSDNV